MKKKFFLFTAIVFCSLLYSQKKSVAITSFEVGSSRISNSYVKAIEDKVKEAFYATNRFDIVDRTSFDKIKAEVELQKSEEFIDGKTVRQFGLDGAEHIVTGRINQVDIELVQLESSEYYDCSISFSLQVVDIETGQIVASEMIKPSQGLLGGLVSMLGGADSREKSFYNALQGTQRAINDFVSTHFPVTTQIIEITDASSSRAKSLLINTGYLYGATKNQRFTVKELVKKEVNGKILTRELEIGQIRISNVEGDEISVARVIKGGDAILKKFNSGATIECYSIN